MPLFGLIGYPLIHSDSPLLYRAFFKKDNCSACRYELFPIAQADQIKNTIQAQTDLQGFNVTTPHKQNCVELCDELSPEAAQTGAVNTVLIEQNRWIGYNTDAFGFEKSLLHFIPDTAIKALVLGTGGASAAVCYVLKHLNIPFLLVSRNPDKNQLSYQSIDKEILLEYKLIVNTTPLGMIPAVKTMPDIPYQLLSSEHHLFDLVYKPVITRFMAEGIKRGCKVKNGLQMLSLQAQKAWSIWKPMVT
jgi:shikimate dehydrogenase